MATKFLTNTSEETSLSERIQALTKSSSSLDFLVGYFFFSGFCEIYEELKDKPLRILIGMDAEVDLNNCIVEYTTTLNKSQITPPYFISQQISAKSLIFNKNYVIYNCVCKYLCINFQTCFSKSIYGEKL